MTDVLLTHSYHLANDTKQWRKMQPYPPLGTLYAATTLRQAGISVAVFDTMFADPIAGFAAALAEHQPKIVVIYEDDFNFVTKMCLTHMHELAQQLASMAEAAGITVIAHGSDATDQPHEYLRHGVRYILNGEAEGTLLELCSALLSGKKPAGIMGLVRYGGVEQRLESSPGAPKNPQWVGLPRVARELINLEPYRQAWVDAHGYFSMNVVSSRGCPYRCNWCAKPISGDRFHLRSAEDVAAEIRGLKEIYGVDHVWFGDDVFALDRRWNEAFAQAVAKGGDPVPFKIQSRADLMTEATVAALKRAGCAEVWMGVESGSQKILDAMGKGIKVEMVHAARERLAAAGIRACYFLQFGYPSEGWPEICDTLRLVRETRPDDIGVSLSYPLPGTVFFDRVQEQMREKRNWKDSDDLCTMHTATYRDEFYHALRDALHAEVRAWGREDRMDEANHDVEALWTRVLAMEPGSRNTRVIAFRHESAQSGEQSSFVPLVSTSAQGRRA